MASSPLTSLPYNQWSDIIQFLSADDLKSLRLSGNREMDLSEPTLTSHLQLRMDKCPFFTEGRPCTEGMIRRWLVNRTRLVLNDGTATLCAIRVSYLVRNGYLDGITQIVVMDCHSHRHIIALLATLPNVESFKLMDQCTNRDIQDELGAIVSSLDRLNMLQSLDIEFDCVVSGRYLAFIEGMTRLKHLRLRGFDLSQGIKHMRTLSSIESLHLCHGNFYSSPEQDIKEQDLLDLIGLNKVRRLHLEGFDCLGASGLKPFSPSACITDLVLKHCQEMDDSCISSIGEMSSLKSLHIINSVFDDMEYFESESIEHLKKLKDLKTLSIFYCMVDFFDILDLKGCDALETLNVAFHSEGTSKEELDVLCNTILPVLPALKKVRIFSDDGMHHVMHKGGLEIEFARFNFGDLVELD